jgi:hypothetical protein
MAKTNKGKVIQMLSPVNYIRQKPAPYLFTNATSIKTGKKRKLPPFWLPANTPTAISHLAFT